jgi:hypothetical protein
MRIFSLAAGLLIPSLLALSESPTENSSIPSIGIFMHFDSQPDPASLEVMEREVGDLLKPSGVTLDWRLAENNEGKESFSGLVVFKFKGRCRVKGWTLTESDFGTPGGTLALASTQVAGGHVLPFSAVECDQVRKALEYLQPGAGQRERQKALGLALGRVMAHELYHIFARTTDHAAAGLAKGDQSLRDLVASREIGFQTADSLAIRNGFH